MENTITKELYEAPKAEISLVSAGDILVDSTQKPKDENQTPWF